MDDGSNHRRIRAATGPDGDAINLNLDTPEIIQSDTFNIRRAVTWLFFFRLQRCLKPAFPTATRIAL